ncbi:MAG: NAD-dependent epimerase/dehydratase family protein [Clostridia bacterium]|nr:NAD-dependent epimerase/dehydratase family protein [Clostridia bacterium]MDD4681142.1 NAD-dependent epimerase/dehydratase family protein [Clostridia bacterium]
MEKLLFTGGTGFLGRNVKPLLEQKYEVTTIGITNQDEIKSNLADEIPMLIDSYDVVLHAAGKAHMIPHTEAEKKVFYDVNLNGTIHLCDSLEKVGVPKSFIFISTVAVYGCEIGENIIEDYPLKGDTPYADSKKKAEAYLAEWCSEHNVVLGIIRPSLLAGPNAPGNLGAMVAGIKSGRYLSISGGKARKSILMVQDIANLVPLLSEKGGIYNVCDTNQPSFGELENLICTQLGKRGVLSIPYWMAKCLALVGDYLCPKAPINSLKLKKMTETLTFSNDKARRELGWEPMDVLTNYMI